MEDYYFRVYTIYEKIIQQQREQCLQVMAEEKKSDTVFFSVAPEEGPI